MICRSSILVLALLTAACNRTSPEEKAANDARDVAQVEAAQKLKPPAQPVAPQPMKREARALFNLSDAGCDFLPTERGSDDPVLIAGGAKALLLVRDEPMILAADSGSTELPSGIYEKYTGRTLWAELTKGPAGSAGGHWPGSLTIRDRYDRIVFFAAGELVCHG